jgi:hypothetical protein
MRSTYFEDIANLPGDLTVRFVETITGAATRSPTQATLNLVCSMGATAGQALTARLLLRVR